MKQHVKEVLERILHDRAATPAEKAQAKKLLDNAIVEPTPRKKFNRSWYLGGVWKKSKVIILGAQPTKGGKFFRFDESPCTDKQWALILKLCYQNNLEPPEKKISFEDARQWLDYMLRR